MRIRQVLDKLKEGVMLGGQIIFINGLPVAGSGKTTWALKHISPLEKYVSRDEVRFSMVTEN